MVDYSAKEITEQIDNLIAQKKVYERNVSLATALQKLFNNSDFNELAEYFNTNVKENAIEQLTSPISDNAERAKQNLIMLSCIANHFNFIASIGDNAQQRINEIDESIKELQDLLANPEGNN